MAPHNLEGTFMLFGDIYAKGGRTEAARGYYEIALSLGEKSGWDPRFVATARERVENLAARVALYQDGDPRQRPDVRRLGRREPVRLLPPQERAVGAARSTFVPTTGRAPAASRW